MYEVNLKTSYDEVTLGEYQQITALGDQLTDLRLISILSDKTIEELNQLPVTHIKHLVSKTQFLHKGLPDLPALTPVVVDSARYTIVPQIENINAGQFISVIELTKDREKITDNLHLLLAVVLRKEVRTGNWLWERWTEVTDRDTPQVMQDAKQLQSCMSVAQAISMASFITKQIKAITKQYRGLFTEQVIEDDDEQQKPKRTKVSALQNFGWFISIEQLADVRNQTWAEIEELKLIEFLNGLSYMKAKGKDNARREKEMRQKMKRKR